MKRRTDMSVEARWTPLLAKQWCAVSSFFLANYHRIGEAKGQRGLNSTEAIAVIQICDFKWGRAAPFPSVPTLAKRTNISERQMRNVLSTLEGLGYLMRVPRGKGKPNAYHLEPLFEALEAMMAREVVSEEAA